jgi:hypothetical protein
MLRQHKVSVGKWTMSAVYLQDFEQHNFVRRGVRRFKSALRDGFRSLVHRLCNALPRDACKTQA